MSFASLGSVLRQRTTTEYITHTDRETFVTLKLRGGGAVRRVIGDGKTPRPFRGYRIRANDFIYSRIDARNGAFALVPRELDQAVVSKDFPSFEIDVTAVDPRYLRWLTTGPSFAERIKQLSFGATNRQRVDEESFLRLTVPLPPLPEQRRIAAILDQADALRALRRLSLARFDALAEATYRSMFEALGEDAIPVPLGTLADIASGITKGRRVPPSIEMREVPYLAVSNVQDRRLDLTVVKRIDATESEIDRYRLRAGDLLLTEGGDPDKLGRGVVWPGLIEPCIHQNHVFRVRITNNEVDPFFLSWHVSSDYGKSYFLRSAKQTTGIASINSSQLKAFPALLPPFEAQREFAHRLRAIAAAKAEAERAAAETDRLFASLEHRAFRGDL